MEQVYFTSTSAVARDSCVSNRGNCHSLREHDQQNGLLQKSEKIHSVKNDLMTLTYNVLVQVISFSIQGCDITAFLYKSLGLPTAIF